MKKKRKHRQKRINESLADTTINHTANAEFARKRLPKSLDSPSKLSIEPPAAEDDLEIHFKDNAKVKNVTEMEHTYRLIGLDIWILISRHIRPEDILTFGLICRQTLSIVQSAQFWFHIYRKYCKVADYSLLPMRLRPESMVRLGGLRACVIRTLYLTYDPFSKWKRDLSQWPNATRRQQVTNMWFDQTKSNLWLFYFKLQFTASATKQRMQLNSMSTYDKLVNIMDNPDDGCQLLIIETQKFVPLPHDQQQQFFLKQASHTLSQGFKEYKFKLILSTYNGLAQATLVYDPVISVRVLDWWHKDYYKECQRISEVVEESTSNWGLS